MACLALILGLAAPGQPLALVLALALVRGLWDLAELGFAGLTALEDMGREARVKTAARLLALAAAGGLLWAGQGLWGFVAGLALANLAAMLASLGRLRGHAAFSLRLDRGFLRGLAKGSLPLALSGVFILFYSRLDVVLLRVMGRPYDEIGWYAAAARMVDGLGVLPGLMAAGLLPVLAGLAGREPQALARLYGQGLKLALLLGLPAGAGLWLVRGPLVELIFGAQYAPTARALAWLAPTLCLIFVNYLQMMALTALGRQSLGALATALSLAVNLGLNLWWIPIWGYQGSAAATLATEATLLLACARFLRQAGGIQAPLATPWRLALRPALATALMLAGLWPLRACAPWLVAPLGLALYLGGGLLLGAFSLADLRLLGSLARPGGWRVEAP
jgi:O-antigen/teichoic acid export membrane protein